MIARRYRIISYWTLGVISLVMFVCIIIAVLAKNEIIDSGIVSTLTPIVYYFLLIVFWGSLLAIVICLSKAFIHKEERKSYLYAGLVFFLSILLLVISVIALFLIIMNGYRG